MINLFLISKYRTVLMGLATIMILMCHANVYGIDVPVYIKKALVYGNYGVDVFLFLSAIGCHRSLTKGGIVELRKWYCRRFYRIWIPYTLVQIPFWGLLLYMGKFQLGDELYKYSTIQFWTEHKGAWYIALIIPLYLCTPLIFKCFKTTKHKIIVLLAFLLSLTIICNIDLSSITINKYPTLIANCQWAFFRCMSFFIGMYLAPFIEKKKNVNCFLFVGTSLILYIVIHSIFPEFFIGWTLVIPICVMFIYIMELFKCTKVLLLFTFLGRISLESYLTNINLNSIMNEIINKIGLNDAILTGHYLEYALVIIIGILISYTIHIIAQKVMPSVQKNKTI